VGGITDGISQGEKVNNATYFDFKGDLWRTEGMNGYHRFMLKVEKVQAERRSDVEGEIAAPQSDAIQIGIDELLHSYRIIFYRDCGKIDNN
jgi:hypothetical protein